MRIGVIGAGALGCLFAARLTLAGHEVQLVARGGARSAIREGGVHVAGRFGAADVPVAVVNSLRDVELVLVAVKAHDTASALSEHREALQGRTVVLLQNGIAGFAIASELLPDAQLFGALSLIAVNVIEPGRVFVTNAQPTFVGRGSGPADADSRTLAETLNEALPTEAIDNFAGALWTKLVLNMVNALPAITGLSVQEVVANRRLNRVLAESMRESVRVAHAAGIHFADLHTLRAERIERLDREPAWRTRALTRSIAKGMGPIPNLASMLQSIQRGRSTEVEFINGAVVRAAEAHGCDAPLNRALTSLVHEVEAGRSPLGPVELEVELREHGVRW